MKFTYKVFDYFLSVTGLNFVFLFATNRVFLAVHGLKSLIIQLFVVGVSTVLLSFLISALGFIVQKIPMSVFSQYQMYVLTVIVVIFSIVALIIISRICNVYLMNRIEKSYVENIERGRKLINKEQH